MIPLIALITGSAKSLLTGELSPIDSINQLDMSPSDIAAAKQQLPIYPYPHQQHFISQRLVLPTTAPQLTAKNLTTIK